MIEMVFNMLIAFLIGTLVGGYVMACVRRRENDMAWLEEDGWWFDDNDEPYQGPYRPHWKKEPKP